MHSPRPESSFGYPDHPDLGPYPPSVLGRNLWHLMHQRGVMVAQLAKVMELSEDMMLDVIQGPERQFVPKMYEKLAEAFVTTPEKLKEDGPFGRPSEGGSDALDPRSNVAQDPMTEVGDHPNINSDESLAQPLIDKQTTPRVTLRATGIAIVLLILVVGISRIVAPLLEDFSEPSSESDLRITEQELEKSIEEDSEFQMTGTPIDVQSAQCEQQDDIGQWWNCDIRKLGESEPDPYIVEVDESGSWASQLDMEKIEAEIEEEIERESAAQEAEWEREEAELEAEWAREE